MNPAEHGGDFFFTNRFEEQSALRLCALFQPKSGGVGTGTLLRHGGDFFVITCGHLAEPLLKDAEAIASFRISIDGSERFLNLPIHTMQCIGLSNDDYGQVPDVALLRINSRILEQDINRLSPITIEDLQFGCDYSNAPVADYLLTGFPKSLTVSRGGFTQGRTLTVQAVPCPRQPSTSNRLFLSYSKSHMSVTPPPPNGMSGSLIWQVTPPEKTPSRQIWVPGKAIAIQSAWDSNGEFLKGHPLDLIRTWLMS